MLIGQARVSTQDQDLEVQTVALRALNVNPDRIYVDHGFIGRDRDIAQEFMSAGAALSLGGSVHDPDDPIGRLLFNVLAMVAKPRPTEPSEDARRRSSIVG